MATLRKRGNKWHTQVRLKGHPPITKSFSHKSDAEAWGRAKEVALETGVSLVGGLSASREHHTLSDLLVRYETEVTSGKRSVIPEGYMIATIKRTLGRDGEPLGSIPLGSLA